MDKDNLTELIGYTFVDQLENRISYERNSQCTLPVRFQEIELEQKVIVFERVAKDYQKSLGTVRSPEANQIGLKNTLQTKNII